MKKNKISQVLLILFIMIQPLLDYYKLYSDEVRNIFGFSPTTIIRFIFAFVFTFWYLLKKDSKKKYLFYFASILMIYLIGHFLNSLAFSNSILKLSFSYKTELLYFLRLLIPLSVIYITYKNDLDVSNFKKVIIITSLIFSLEIIITNILKISLTSYGGNNIIKGSIFSWFGNHNYKFADLASKGFFCMANQVSVILCMLLTINIYFAIKYNKVINIITCILLIISMLMLGTRVATYGWIIISIGLYFGWILFAILHKNKIDFTINKSFIYIIIGICLGLLTLYSPAIAKRDTIEDEKALAKKAYDSIVIDQNADLNTRIIAYHNKYLIPLEYLNDIYPYQNDSSFWEKLFTLPYSVRGGNRNLEKLITKRIYELNNNKMDKFWGMGYSRFINATLYIEQDFISHFYTIGLIGIFLLLTPYILISSYAIIWMLKFNKLRMRTTILCGTIYLAIIISIFSGHVMDELLATIILGFISGFALSDIKRSKENMSSIEEKKDVKIKPVKKKTSPKVSIIVPVYNVSKYLEKCLLSLVNQTLEDIEIIIVNDGSPDNSQDIIDKYKKDYPHKIVSFIKENGGLSDARNFGIDHAKADYIGFVDGDDYVDVSMFEKMYNKAISNDFDLVVCNLNYVYDYDVVPTSGNIPDDTTDIKKAMLDIYPTAWNKLYKKDILNKNKLRFKKGVWFEDVEFVYRLLPYINNIGVVKECFYEYVQREGAISKTYDERLYHYIDNFNGIVKYYKDHKLYQEYFKELEFAYVRYIYGTFIKQAMNYPVKKFIKAIKDAKRNVKKQFPKYRQNRYFYKNIKGWYMILFNKPLLVLYYLIKGGKHEK